MTILVDIHQAVLCFTFFCMWERCKICHKPLNNEANILKLRILCISSGALFLPVIGFGFGGVAAGSIAASFQGPAVVAGSMFAVLQSLGATGLGILLFGSAGAAVSVLAPYLSLLGWCDDDDHSGDDDDNSPMLLNIQQMIH